ncbi:esterase/lipase/thioesterase family protein, partial [Trifolium pratense]
GGDVVLLYASKYHDIKTVVNLSGRYDLKAGIEERLGKDYLEIIKKDGFIDVKKRSGSLDYHVTEESLMDRLGTNMHEACLQIDKECRLVEKMFDLSYCHLLLLAPFLCSSSDRT